MNMFIESITFKANWRCFKQGETIHFKPGLNIIVGEQGTGKSSLLHLITLKKEKRNEIATLKAKAARFLHFDSEKMNPRTKAYIDNEMDVASHFLSHGETLFPILSETGRHRDSLILLDEPETALSIANTCRFIAALKKAEQNGNQILIATHHPVVMNSQDTVLEMDARQFVPTLKYIRSQAGRSWKYFNFQQPHAAPSESNAAHKTARNSAAGDRPARRRPPTSQGSTDRSRPTSSQPRKKPSDTREAHAPLNEVCEKCGRIYCDHEEKY